MKCQCQEEKGQPQGLGRAGQRVLGAGQEGHSAPSSWSFLLLSGPVTSFQSRASLTEQAEKGGEAKQLRHPPNCPGSLDLSCSCLAALIKATSIKSGTAKFFCSDFRLSHFHTQYRALAAPSTHPASTECWAGSRARVPRKGPGSQGDTQRGEKRWDHQLLSGPLARGDQRWTEAVLDGQEKQGHPCVIGCRPARGSGALNSTEKVQEYICGVRPFPQQLCRKQGMGSLSSQAGRGGPRQPPPRVQGRQPGASLAAPRLSHAVPRRSCRP